MILDTGKMLLVVLVVSIVATIPQYSRAQLSPSLDSLMSAGNLALQQENWADAVTNFEKLIKADTTNMQAAFQLGQAFYMLGDYRKAATAWELAEAKKYRLPTTRYNLASTYTQMNDKEKAFSWLAQALDAGFSRVDVLKSDKVLDTLRSDERFAKVLEFADQNARPCEYDQIYRLLDFWLGEWDVFVNENQKIGISVVRKMVNGCAIQENYEQTDGFVGENLFYYNNLTGEWKMVWVTGAAVSLGGVKEKVMTARDDNGGVRFSCELPDKTTGQKILDRSTITPVSKDRVNMVIQQSRDGGDNWITTFSGFYQRMKQ